MEIEKLQVYLMAQFDLSSSSFNAEQLNKINSRM